MPIDLLSPATALDLGGYDVPEPAYIARSYYAISNLSAANYYATQDPGGLAGSVAGSWHGILGRIESQAVSSTVRQILGRISIGVTNGYYTRTTGMNASIATTFYQGAGVGVDSPSYTFTASDVGKIFAVAYVNDTTRAKAYFGRAELGAPGTALSGFRVHSGKMELGPNATFTSADGYSVLAWGGGDGFIPTLAELQAWFDAVRNAGDWIDIPGKTTLAYPLRRALAGTSVVDGQTAPASLADTVTGAAADAMGRVGSPAVKVIDRSIDGRETYGALGFSATSSLQTATPGGVRGSLAGFSFVHHATIWSLSGIEVLYQCGNSSGTQGWYLVRENATLRWYSSNGAGGIASSPTRTLTSAHLGRPLIIHGVRDASSLLYLYVDGVSAGAATGPVASYALASWATMIGVNQALANPAANMSWFGSGGGSGASYIMDAAEVAAHYAASITAGKIAAHAKLEHLWYPTQDILAAGGPDAGIPAQVLDRVGTDHLTRVGTGLCVAQRVERVWSYETSPILLGVEGITTSDFFETLVNALPGDATSFAVSWFGKVSQAVASASRRLFSQRYGNNPGWDLYTSGTNGTANFGCGGASGAAASPTSTIAAADAGKLLLFTGVYDGIAGKARLYAKRAEVASGSTLTGGYLPDSSVKAQIGRRDGPTPSPADGVSTYGVAYSLGLPTLAQIQAQHDSVMASERIQTIPGLPGMRIDLTADVIANRGLLPSTLSDRGTLGVSFSRIGSPALSSHYTRSFVW